VIKLGSYYLSKLFSSIRTCNSLFVFNVGQKY